MAEPRMSLQELAEVLEIHGADPSRWPDPVAAQELLQVDPDAQARAVVHLVFEKFDEIGSIYGLFRWLIRHDILMPIRAVFVHLILLKNSQLRCKTSRQQSTK